MRRYLIFAVASLAVLLSSIDATAVSVAYPVIISSFDVSLVAAGWILTAYQLALTAVLPVAGKISDALGRKRMFLAFVSLFAIGSLLCSFAPNGPSLIIFRVIQGLGGSGLMPSASGFVTEAFPHARQRAIGLFSSIMPVGWIIGPNLGGWMTTALGWRSIFWINIPLCAIAIVVSAILISPGKREKSHIDLIGSALLAAALLTLMVGLNETANMANTRWLLVGVLLSASLTSLVLFWKRTKTASDPLIEPEILSQRPFLAANAFNFVFGGIMGAMALVPLYAVSIYGMSTLESGFILTPRSISMIIVSAITSFFLMRWGYRRPMLIGVATVAPVLVILALEPQGIGMMGFQISSTVLLMANMFVQGTAAGFMAPASNNACIELMPHRVGTIVSIRMLFRQTGSILSITVGSLLLDTQGIAHGFQLYFFGLVAIIIAVMIPAVMAMPRSPRVEQ